MKTRVGIVDDHPALILGVAAFLVGQADLQVVGAADRVATLLASGARFDVVLLDLVLADDSTPAQNVQALRAAGIPVLAYTSGERPHLVREAGRAGVSGMIRKSERPAAVAEAVRAVARGEIVATPDWAAALDADTRFVDAELTDREAEVLALYASGETAERVGAHLFISRETVLDHIRRIRAKYAGVKRPAPTKVDLFRRAVEDGIVDSER